MTWCWFLKFLGFSSELDELTCLSKRLDIDALTNKVAEKITSVAGYQISMWDDFNAPRLYRARKHNHLEGNLRDEVLHRFESESEFWNTLPEFCPLGRCQDIGESLLYCSTSWDTAISEVRPNTGDYVSVSVYNARPKPNNPEELLGSRIVPIGVQYLSQIERLKHMFENYNFNGRSVGFYELDNYLDDLFHKDVDDHNQHLYKLSTAVTRCMMKNVTDGVVVKQTHGMIYSSIVRNRSDYNFVLRPIHARTIYVLHQAQTFRVLESTDELIRLQLVRNGFTFGTKEHLLDFFEMVWVNVNDNIVIEEIIKPR